MRKVLLYLAGLTVAAAAVFFLAFFLGRRTTLERQLERLAGPPRSPQGKSSGIPSLHPPETPPETPPDSAAPEGDMLGEGIWIRRTPRAEAGLVLALDIEALASLESPGTAGPGGLREGLDRFLAEAPPGVRIGLRTLGGGAGDCSGTTLVQACGAWSAEDLRGAIDTAGTQGARNPLKAVEQGSADLEGVPGERAVVILAGGASGCSVDLCTAALPQGAGSPRIHVILLAPAPAGGEAAPDASAAPVFEPPWAGAYRCLAERSGGSFSVAVGPEELTDRLRRIARSLEAVVAVRMFHAAGREAQGVSSEGSVGWGVTLRRSGEGEGAGLAREQPSLPAAFAVTAGTYVLHCRYQGLEKTAAVTVAPQERAEVRVEFATGEIYIQAEDEKGKEFVGDTAGFRCVWGAEVLQDEEDEEKIVRSTCSFPARFELPPGGYRLRVWWKGKEQVLEEVPVEAAETTVRTVVFAKE